VTKTVSSARSVVLARWDERIARARHLALAPTPASQLLEFYAGLAECQRAIAAASPPAAWSPGGVASDLDLDEATSAVPGLLNWLRRHAPARLEQAVVHRPSLVEWRALIARRLAHEDLSDHAAAFVVEAVLQPLAELLAAEQAATGRPTQAKATGPSATCPVCLDRPTVATLRDAGHGAKRALVCGLCMSEWDYPRVLCPVCGEQEFDRLPVYSADALTHVRVDGCDRCHTYVKAVDLTKDGLAVALVDDLASVTLDLWAREHGYRRISPSLLRLEAAAAV
jgi:FdhE protein